MARLWDYDGSIRAWDEFGILPDAIAEFRSVVIDKAKGKELIVAGDRDGLVSASLAAKGFVVRSFIKTPDIKDQMAYEVVGGRTNREARLVPAHKAPLRPRATGAYGVMEVDPASKEFTDFLHEGTALVGRRTLFRCYSAEWMERVNESGVKLIVSESLQGGKELFNSVEIEAMFLKRHGWTTYVTKGRIVWATRN